MQNHVWNSKRGCWRIVALGAVYWTICPLRAQAQPSADLKEILERLQRLEESNRALVAEVASLRSELAATRGPTPAPQPAEETLSVLERRVEEQAQSKVESSQRFPIRVTGMALFNAFLNSSGGGGRQYPTVAVPGSDRTGGGSMRQSVIGLDFRGPETVWGGKVRGALALDLYGGSGQSLDQLLRFRTGSVAIDWKSRTFMTGVDKPIVAPREPSSLAQVAYSPLTGAGNLWLWMPQARFEQDVRLGERSRVRAQLGVVEVHDNYTSGTPGYAPYVERSRPGLQGRFEFRTGSERRLEIAPGFHASSSHAGGYSLPSRLFSLDWLAQPWRTLDLTGAFFAGQNVAPLGTGGAGGGLASLRAGQLSAVHSLGGWGQVTYRATPRLSFNLFSGQQDNRERDLEQGQVGKNLAYGGNFFYRLAPNVVLSLELSQVRTQRTTAGTLLNNHYDLALAYLF
jgi:hypothetical protein